MIPLAEKYVTKIEGFIPDLCVSENDSENHDAVYDFAADHICDQFTRELRPIDHDVIREAAKQIADHYFGEQQ